MSQNIFRVKTQFIGVGINSMNVCKQNQSCIDPYVSTYLR